MHLVSFLSFQNPTLYVGSSFSSSTSFFFTYLQSLIQGCSIPSSRQFTPALPTLPSLFFSCFICVLLFSIFKKKKKSLIINRSTMELMAQLGKREKIKEGPLSTFIWHKNAAAENGKTENACMLIQTNLACACVPKGSSWRRAGGGEEGGKRGILETKKKKENLNVWVGCSWYKGNALGC